MNELLDPAKSVLRSAWRHRKLAMSVAWLTAVISAAVVPFIPQRYEASARIYVDTQSVLKPLMAGLAYQPDIDQQVRMLARTVISRPNLERLLNRPELELSTSTPAERELTLAQLMEQIKLAMIEANLYTISYRDVQPERAQRMVEAALDLFVNSSSGDKRRDSEEASRFIENQIQSYETKLTEAENRLKDFKLRNFGLSGVSNQDYFTRISAMSDEMKRLGSDLRAAEQARDSYRRELAAEDPHLPVVSDVDLNLSAQKKQLEELLRRFTEEHPDVSNTRYLIAQLEAQKRDHEQARLQGDAGTPGLAAPTSPVYQRIRVALAETEAQVASLRSRYAVEQQRLDEARATAGRMPQVEAELTQLNRDYDVIRKNYDQLVARRESASLGLKLDESVRLADFRVVEPPRVSPKPVFPGHLLLAVIAIAASLGLGLLAPTMVGFIRPTYEDAKSLRELTGRPVLGTVSLSVGKHSPQNLRSEIVLFSSAAALLVLLQLAWLAWLGTHSLA
jgi:polysaccharide chain length determinant protein (PEP-CTERM system associated)